MYMCTHTSFSLNTDHIYLRMRIAWDSPKLIRIAYGVTNGHRDHTVHKGHSHTWIKFVGIYILILLGWFIDHRLDIYSCDPPDGLTIMRN